MLQIFSGISKGNQAVKLQKSVTHYRDDNFSVLPRKNMFVKVFRA